MNATGGTTFTDPVTSRTVRRLTAGGLNVSPYFNSYAWTADGDWFFFLRLDGHELYVMGCEVATGHLHKVSGPFPGPQAEGSMTWPTLNDIPGTRAATFVAEKAVWRLEIDRGKAEKVAELPTRDFDIGDSDVSSDGRWHMMGCVWMNDAVRAELVTAGWPPDAVFRKRQIGTQLLRVNLDSGATEELWEEPAVVDHISVNPTDADLVLYCHEGAIPYRYGRMFLRRVGDESSLPVRDQRSGRVWVTHECWFSDGRRIAYHGLYRLDPPESPLVHYVGIYDTARQLPHEYTFPDASLSAWHSIPSPHGDRLVMDQRGGQDGLFLLTPDQATGICHVEQLTSICSDGAAIPRDQWREQDPIWSPDGKWVLFRAALKGEIDVYAVEAG